MNSIKCQLSATVVHTNGATRRPTTTTVALVKFGPLLIGSAKLYGKWSAEQVLADFKLKKGNFKLTPAGEAVIKTL